MLNSKLSLLEPSQLDQVEGRLQSVMHKLNQISEKQPEQQAEQQEEQKKVCTGHGIVIVIFIPKFILVASRKICMLFIFPI